MVECKFGIGPRLGRDTESDPLLVLAFIFPEIPRFVVQRVESNA